ncbi:hypothetical protein ACQ4PT_038107 [Festuca glaucescens]
MARWELPLAWSARLESYARWWGVAAAGRLRAAALVPGGPVRARGEHLLGRRRRGVEPRGRRQGLGRRGVDYSYAANACAPGRDCGHYTQIVWRGTASVGCARVVCDDGGVFMTCNYYPPGNVVGAEALLTAECAYVPNALRCEIRI